MSIHSQYKQLKDELKDDKIKSLINQTFLMLGRVDHAALFPFVDFAGRRVVLWFYPKANSPG